MRPSLPPDMGDNAAAQATLEARLRREQIKPVTHMEDLKNVTGNATDGQALLYSQAQGAWTPGNAGIQGDRLTASGGGGTYTGGGNRVINNFTTQSASTGTSIQISAGSIAFYSSGFYFVRLRFSFSGATDGGIRRGQFDWSAFTNDVIDIDEAGVPPVTTAGAVGKTEFYITTLWHLDSSQWFGQGVTGVNIYHDSASSLTVSVDALVVRLA